MGGVLDAPMPSDGCCRPLCRQWRVGGVECGLAGAAEQACGGIAGVDLTLDADERGDVILPAGVGQPGGGIEDGDGAAFVAVAAFVAADGRTEWRGGLGDRRAVLEQGRLVFLDLDDQPDLGRGCGGEVFF